MFALRITFKKNMDAALLERNTMSQGSIEIFTFQTLLLLFCNFALLVCIRLTVKRNSLGGGGGGGAVLDSLD